MENDLEIWFNGYNLNLIPNVYLTKTSTNTDIPIKTNSYELIRQDGSITTSVKKTVKNIDFSGFILAPNKYAYEEAIDLLKYRTSATERTLSIIQAGSERRYTVSKSNLIEQYIGYGKGEISLSFLCSDPFGRATNLTAADFTITDSPASLEHEFLGSALAKPVFALTINSGTGTTGKYLGVGNGNTGQQVQILRNWTAGDTVVFNTDLKKAFVNDQPSDYNGVFPEFLPYQGTAYYYDNFTTRNVSVSLSYVKRFI